MVKFLPFWARLYQNSSERRAEIKCKQQRKQAQFCSYCQPLTVVVRLAQTGNGEMLNSGLQSNLLSSPKLRDASILFHFDNVIDLGTE